MFSVRYKLNFIYNYIRLCFLWGTNWIYIYYWSYCAFCKVWIESLGDWWWLFESTLLKVRAKSSIQKSGCSSMNRGFQGKHLYAGVNVCILSVFHEGSWLWHWMLWSIYIVFFWVLSQYSPVIGFWYCTGILYCQLKCAFVSLPTVWAARYVPQGLRCLLSSHTVVKYPVTVMGFVPTGTIFQMIVWFTKWAIQY
jgi:hypothetical protein